GKWICMITDPTIAKEICLRTDIFPKIMLNEIIPIGIDVVRSNGIKVDGCFGKVNNKSIDVKDLMQRFTLDVLGKNLEYLNNAYVTAYNDAHNMFKSSFYNNILPIDRIPILKRLAFRKIGKLSNLFDTGHSNGDLLELMLKACDDPNISDKCYWILS
ncbi:16968_t:CDS:2, partial [Dentiscutata heterogama]